MTSARGESLSLMLQSAEELKLPQQTELRNRLLQHARFQALEVRDCKANKDCASLSGKPLPDDATIERALSFK